MIDYNSLDGHLEFKLSKEKVYIGKEKPRYYHRPLSTKPNQLTCIKNKHAQTQADQK